MNFSDIAKPGRCDVCGKKTDVAVFASQFGPISFAYCADCAKAGAEPYGAVVSYIACAGPWPDAISKDYQDIVREQLKFHNIPEERFAQNVQECIDSMNAFFADAEMW